MARAAIFRVANNQHDSVFRPVLRNRCECQRRSKKDRGEEASVHKRDDSGARAERQSERGCVHRFSTAVGARNDAARDLHGRDRLSR